MRYYKRLKVYKSNNVVFDPTTCSAYSYEWWKFVGMVNGKVLFNNYNYSNTTCKHQSKVRSLLDSLNIKIDAFVEFPRGLDDANSAISHYIDKISHLKAELAKPRSQFKTNVKRLFTMAEHDKKIKLIKKLYNI